MSSNEFDRIHALCFDKRSSESELITQLETILRTNPEVLNEQDDYGRTLLHWAIIIVRRSVGFIKLLVETNLESVRTIDSHGNLPIHAACFACNVEVVKYLYSIYPESINIAAHDGKYPLHIVLLLCLKQLMAKLRIWFDSCCNMIKVWFHNLQWIMTLHCILLVNAIV
jgi:hypothetical protein